MCPTSFMQHTCAGPYGDTRTSSLIISSELLQSKASAPTGFIGAVSLIFVTYMSFRTAHILIAYYFCNMPINYVLTFSAPKTVAAACPNTYSD